MNYTAFLTAFLSSQILLNKKIAICVKRLLQALCSHPALPVSSLSPEEGGLCPVSHSEPAALSNAVPTLLHGKHHKVTTSGALD